MAQNPRDYEKWKNDPAFQGDRDFLERFFTDFLEKKAKEAKEREESENPPTIFDRLFGGL